MRPTRLCLACGNVFHPLLQVPNQRYCPAAACQRERRRRWQREHLRSDADYRDNQARAQAKWRVRHPDYWRQYRSTHPAYRERNCAMQRNRNAERSSGPVANIDAGQTGSRLVAFAKNRNAVNNRIWGIMRMRKKAGDRIPKLYIENRNDSRSVSWRVWNSIGFGKPFGPSLMYLHQ